MSEERYNGWANYPTWCVNLWLSNDEGLYRMTLDAVHDEYDDAPECINVRDGIWTLEQARRFNTADRLREMVEELGTEVDNFQGGTESGQLVGFGADLFGWALAQVDWTEIADAWLAIEQEARAEA